MSLNMNPIAVVGRGPVGLAAALLLARAGRRVVLIGPEPNASDGRTVAIMSPAVGMLDRAGGWDACRAHAEPLRTLSIIDDTGRLLRAPTAIFEATEIGEEAFGWSVATDDLIASLGTAIKETDTIECLEEGVVGLTPLPDGVQLTCANGDVVEAALVIAADGRRSFCREALGISVSERRYPQTAVVFNIRHERPHRQISTEFHRRTGPFTLVPLPGNRCGIVAVEDPAGAETLTAMDDTDLAREVERRSHRIVGAVTIDGTRHAFPLAKITASSFARGNTLLVGEAAHVMPPIGAQGLNLGLRDVAMAVETITESSDPATAATAYERSRRTDVALRMAGVNVLNQSLLSNLLPVQALRAAGLAALSGIGPLRRQMMREGMAPSLSLPRLMRRDAA